MVGERYFPREFPRGGGGGGGGFTVTPEFKVCHDLKDVSHCLLFFLARLIYNQ